MSKFVYVTYIRTTQEKLWAALTTPETMRQYWFGMHQETDWKPGSPWKLVFEDGRVADAGEVVEFDPPKRLAMKWRNEFKPELKEEGFSLCVMELAQDGEVMLWMREPFLSHCDAVDMGRFIVHGHTPVRDGRPDLRRRRLNLDTAAVLGGPLTAAAFDDSLAAPLGFLTDQEGSEMSGRGPGGER